jgi:hypothetical protein
MKDALKELMFALDNSRHYDTTHPAHYLFLVAYSLAYNEHPIYIISDRPNPQLCPNTKTIARIRYVCPE